MLRVLYLVFNEGYGGDVDLSAEAIRLTRLLAAATEEPEVAGLLALMPLHDARRASRTGPVGRLVPLAQQDRSRWDTGLIAEGVALVQAALARDRLGEYQAQAAIAALHADAPSAAEGPEAGLAASAGLDPRRPTLSPGDTDADADAEADAGVPRPVALRSGHYGCSGRRSTRTAPAGTWSAGVHASPVSRSRPAAGTGAGRSAWLIRKR